MNTDTAGRKRRAAARELSNEELVDAYTEARIASIRDHRQTKVWTELRAELLRRLNDTDAASAAAGSVTIPTCVAESVGEILDLLDPDDMSDHVQQTIERYHVLIAAAESAEASGEER